MIEPADSQEDDGPDETTADVPLYLRALIILEQLVGIRHPATLAEISRRTSIPASTVRRICNMMEQRDYIARDIEGRLYMPGPKIWVITTGLPKFDNFFKLYDRNDAEGETEQTRSEK